MSLILFLGGAFGQTTTLTKNDYLQKSKNQKTAGIVVPAGGTTMMIIGIIMGSNNDSLDNFWVRFKFCRWHRTATGWTCCGNAKFYE